MGFFLKSMLFLPQELNSSCLNNNDFLSSYSIEKLEKVVEAGSLNFCLICKMLALTNLKNSIFANSAIF